MSNETSNESFDDLDELDKLMKDAKAADTVTVSSVDDAQATISDFRESTAESPWASLDRTEVADRLEQIISNPRQVRQGALNMCGPAALFSQWAKRDPVEFASFATTLFDTGSGSIGSLQVTPKEDLVGTRYAEMLERMGTSVCPQADWMILSSLRNSTDVFWQGSFTGNPEQELAAGTRPAELAEWFTATGIYTKVRDEANWATSAGIPHALNLQMFEGHDISLLIHSNLIVKGEPLKGGKPDTNWLTSQFPNHWVVLLNEILSDIQTRDITLNVWSWGETYSLRVHERDFVENYFGAVIATM